MPGWDSIERLIDLEANQLKEEGAIPEAAEAAATEARHRRLAGCDEFTVWAAFDNVPRRPDFPFIEPGDLAGIRAARAGRDKPLRLRGGEAELRDRLLGAWLGRCIGCALGKPVEAFMRPHGGLASWQRVKAYLTAISPDEWPIRGYIPEHSPAESHTGRTVCPASTREHIRFMETDDDIRYTVLGQYVLQTYGRDFLPIHAARAWFDKLAYGQVCTAETQAYRNLAIWDEPVRRAGNPAEAAAAQAAADWTRITHHLNPYREWIGAQIRCDSYGYAAPGRPALAAELAWRDASISHVKNGIYGSMFCAAMMAAAFSLEDPMEIVEAGLAQIPAHSRLHADIRHAMALCRALDFDFDRFEEAIEELHRRWGHLSPVHTNNNAALCVTALLLGGGDPVRSISLAVMGGWDTDCNGATVGSIVGILRGAGGWPRAWSEPLHDTLYSAIVDYHPIAISECARRAGDLALQFMD